MYGTRDTASEWERDWQEHTRSWGFQLGLSSKTLFHQERSEVSGMTHGDDLVLTGPTKRLTEFENKMTGVSSNQSTNHQLRFIKEHQSVEQKGALGKERNCFSARSLTCRRACEGPDTSNA